MANKKAEVSETERFIELWQGPLGHQANLKSYFQSYLV